MGNEGDGEGDDETAAMSVDSDSVLIAAAIAADAVTVNAERQGGCRTIGDSYRNSNMLLILPHFPLHSHESNIVISFLSYSIFHHSSRSRLLASLLLPTQARGGRGGKWTGAERRKSKG